jgi:hypothetical protein
LLTGPIKEKIMQIKWNQASTKRGAVVLFLASVGTVGWWMGKDITVLLVLTQAISGYLKITVPD